MTLDVARTYNSNNHPSPTRLLMAVARSNIAGGNYQRFMDEVYIIIDFHHRPALSRRESELMVWLVTYCSVLKVFLNILPPICSVMALRLSEYVGSRSMTALKLPEYVGSALWRHSGYVGMWVAAL